MEQLSPEENVTALKTMIIEPLKELMEDMDKFQQLVEQTIDLEAAEKGDFMVNPGFSDDFKSNNLKFYLIIKNIYRISIRYTLNYKYLDFKSLIRKDLTLVRKSAMTVGTSGIIFSIFVI